MADQEIDIEGIQRALDELQEKFGISDKSLSDFTKTVKKTSADFQKELSNLNKEIAKGKKGYEDQLGLLKKLDDAIDDLTDSMENEKDATKKLAAEQTKAALLAQRDSLQASASIRGLSEATAKATTSIALAGVKGAGDFVKGLQENASGVDLATGLMKAGIDVATAGTKGLGQGLQAAAPMLMRFGPVGMVAAAALEIFGIALDKGADSMNKLAKFAVDILQKEVEKTVKSFNTMNASGAMFATGMQGMRNASAAANLTVEQFSNVIKDNSAAIAAAGYGVTEGAQKIGAVTKTFSTFDKTGKVVNNSLLSLGFGFEEQAALVADTMRDMRAAGGGPLKASTAEVAAQTQKYAENLRIIAAVTGEDAKKKMQETREQANQLMFQQKLAGMDETQRQNVINAMGNMSKQQQKDYMDLVNFGAVINTTGAVMSATMPSYAASIQASADATKRGVLDDAKQREINARYQKGINKEAMDQTGIAAANAASLSGAANDAAVGILDVVNYNKNQTKEAIDAANKDLKGAKAPTDPLTKSLMAAEIGAQQLKLTMQKMMDVPIEKYAQTATALLDNLQKLIDDTFGKNYSPEDAKRLNEANQLSKMTGQDLGTSDDTKIRKSKEREWMKKQGISPWSLDGINYENGIKPKGMPMFAEGGTIPAGTAGIVGEAGPEIVKGPAEVTSAKESKEILGKLDNTSSDTSAKESKELLGKLGNLSVGQLTSQAMSSMQGLTSEGKGSIAGYFLEAAAALKWVGDKDNGAWTLGGEVVDQNTAREILDFARGWPKLKQEIQSELDKAKDMIGEGGTKLDAAIKESGGSTKMSDYATGYAKGGIASGSLSGYSATLHGTEAVVPLPDNKSIPVSLDGSALSGALQAQSDILNNILSAMQQNNKYASGLLQASM